VLQLIRTEQDPLAVSSEIVAVPGKLVPHAPSKLTASQVVQPLRLVSLSSNPGLLHRFVAADAIPTKARTNTKQNNFLISHSFFSK